MKILVINQLYKMGGSEVQTLREIEVLRAHGHDVYHITFDATLPDGNATEDPQHYNIVPKDNKYQNWHVKRIKRFFINKNLLNVVNTLIRRISPEAIHLNNIHYEPITVYKAIEPYPALQTIRDFGAICPNGLGVNKSYQPCKGYLHCNCIKECAPKGKRQRMYFWMDKQYLIRQNNVRKKSINRFISPSQSLTNFCTANGIPTECLNNSFDFSLLNNFKKEEYSSHKIYLYYGLVAKHKGVMQLIEAFKKFSEGKDVELQIIGKIEQGFEDQFKNKIINSDSIKYLGVMKYADIIKHLEKVYSVVVPSLWLENYPNTALEGLATQCLVIGANRGGIPELIADDRFVFNVLDINEIISAFENTYSLSQEEYERVTMENYLRVTKQNSLEIYYNRIIYQFDQILKEV
ncbi:glycosyltransferase [Neobacillus sp. K501]